MSILPEAKQENGKQVREEACNCHMFGGPIIWENTFSSLSLFLFFFFFCIYLEISKISLQYGNHAYLKGMKGKFNKEIPKSSD